MTISSASVRQAAHSRFVEGDLLPPSAKRIRHGDADKWFGSLS